MALQWYNRDVTVVLQWCNNMVTVVSQLCNSASTIAKYLFFRSDNTCARVRAMVLKSKGYFVRESRSWCQRVTVIV
jgi:hypothetical protein